MARASGEREKGREREEDAICPGTGWLVWAGPEREFGREGVQGGSGASPMVRFISPEAVFVGSLPRQYRQRWMVPGVSGKKGDSAGGDATRAFRARARAVGSVGGVNWSLQRRAAQSALLGGRGGGRGWGARKCGVVTARGSADVATRASGGDPEP